MENMSAMLAEQTKSWSPHSKDAIFIPPNISRLEIWALQSSRYYSLYWRILSCAVSRDTQDLYHRHTRAAANRVLSQSLSSFATQWAWNILFCLLDIIVQWIVFFAKWQIHFILFIANHTFIFRHLNRNSKYEVQVDYYTQETKEDGGGLGLFFLIWFLFWYTIQEHLFKCPLKLFIFKKTKL